jgi:4,5-DOPA dioxygenase extradiol
MDRLRTIHDFSGFPDALRRFQYRAAGSPELAAEVAEVVKPTRVDLDAQSWGLDHGTWSVLCHVFPNADVPVVQLSLDARRSFDEHVALGAALESLRHGGVLIVGSGNVVHNLGLLRWRDAEFDWNRRFDEAAREVMAHDPSAAAALRQHRDYRLAVPTPDHFLPLLYVAGVASVARSAGEVLVGGTQMGSLSMTSFVVR